MLTNIALCWDHGTKPRIQISLDRERLCTFASEAEAVQLVFAIDGRVVERWTRQSDGNWHGTDKIFCEPEGLKLQPNLLPTLLTVSTKDGRSLEEVDLTQCDLRDDVVIFDLKDAVMRDSENASLDPNREYALLCEADLDLSGISNPPWDKVGSRKVYRLPPPWPEDVRLLLGDLIFWEPVIRRRPPREQINIILRTPQNVRVALGSNSFLTVEGLPADAREVKLFIGKKEKGIEVSRGANTWDTARPVAMSVDFAMGLETTRVQVKREASVRCYRPRLSFQLTGMAVITSNEQGSSGPQWRRHEPTIPLNVAGGHGSGRIFTTCDDRDVLVYEGPRLAGRLRSQILRVSDLHGWGGAVTVEGDDVTQLASATEDRGCMNFYLDSLLGRPMPRQIRLRSPIEPGSSHRLIVWSGDTRGPNLLNEISPSHIRVENEGFVWKIEDSPMVLALGLSFEGVCLGSWWKEENIVRCLRGQVILEFFAALRWLKVPVLSPGIEATMRAAVMTSPIQFLKAWWLSGGLQPGLKHRNPDQGIDTVVRWFLWDWRRSNMQTQTVNRILDMFAPEGTDSSGDRIAASVVAIGKLCPPLVWSSRLVMTRPKYAKRALRRLLALPDDAQEEQFATKLTTLAEECAKRTRAECKKVEELKETLIQALEANTKTDADADRHLRRIAETEVGRCYLAASILHRLTQRTG